MTLETEMKEALQKLVSISKTYGISIYVIRNGKFKISNGELHSYQDADPSGLWKMPVKKSVGSAKVVTQILAPVKK